jgi:hypothetical protein
MKLGIVLMILLSIIMGISTNLGWFTLYGTEFLGPISLINAGLLTLAQKIVWCVLLFSHILTTSLFFLTKNKRFMLYLVWFPLQFILVFVIFNLLVVFLLIPYIVTWIFLILKQRKIMIDLVI